MELEDLVSGMLLELVPPDWWATEEGCTFLKSRELKQSWAEFLGKFGFDVWFTLTFRDGASSATLAVDRTARLLKRACKSIKMECNAFIVAEQHINGTYHSHGLMRLGALTEEYESDFLRHFWQVAFEMYGRNSFTRIGDVDAVGSYVAKYLTKELADYRFIGCKYMPLANKTESGSKPA